MTQREVCQQIMDVIYGMYEGEISYGADPLHSALGFGDPVPFFESAFEDVYYTVLIQGKEVDKARLEKLHQDLSALADRYSVSAFDAPLQRLQEYLK